MSLMTRFLTSTSSISLTPSCFVCIDDGKRSRTPLFDIFVNDPSSFLSSTKFFCAIVNWHTDLHDNFCAESIASRHAKNDSSVADHLSKMMSLSLASLDSSNLTDHAKRSLCLDANVPVDASERRTLVIPILFIIKNYNKKKKKKKKRTWVEKGNL